MGWADLSTVEKVLVALGGAAIVGGGAAVVIHERANAVAVKSSALQAGHTYEISLYGPSLPSLAALNAALLKAGVPGAATGVGAIAGGIVYSLAATSTATVANTALYAGLSVSRISVIDRGTGFVRPAGSAPGTVGSSTGISGALAAVAAALSGGQPGVSVATQTIVLDPNMLAMGTSASQVTALTVALPPGASLTSAPSGATSPPFTGNPTGVFQANASGSVFTAGGASVVSGDGAGSTGPIVIALTGDPATIRIAWVDAAGATHGSSIAVNGGASA